MGKYTVELNPHHGDPKQVQVEAHTMLEAVTTALSSYEYHVDFEDPPDHEPQYAGFRRLTVNVIMSRALAELTGICDDEDCGTERDPDNPKLCAVCGDEVEE